ncbi:MAG: LacI family DNA-binding transcriptional regulator [Actinobacteria bacterium]|nr:LacI family DNA-binding transcriptional regulator [Actinomycetota bacterium]
MVATIADVARLAGVGVGTVSRVLNGRPNVGASTRARVLAVITELDYVPNATARSLSSGRTRTIAVVCIHFIIPSVIERIHGAERTLTDAGFDLIIRNVETAERRDQALRDLTHAERVDGAILISVTPNEQDYQHIRAAGLPVVLVDASHRSMARFVCDDVEGGATAGRHLLSLGHRRIGFVGDPPRPSLGVPSSRSRLRGLREALAEQGLDVAPHHLAEGEHFRAGGYESALRILKLKDRPTAVFAANDTLAFGVLQAARELGLRVPTDLSVIGYDDIDAADLVGMTTVHQPLYDSGAAAAARLLRLLNGQDHGPLRTVMPTRLTVRETTAPPNTGTAPVKSIHGSSAPVSSSNHHRVR